MHVDPVHTYSLSHYTEIVHYTKIVNNIFVLVKWVHLYLKIYKLMKAVWMVDTLLVVALIDCRCFLLDSCFVN